MKETATGRDELLAALERQEKRLTSLMNASTESLYLFNADGDVQLINEEGAKRLGRPVDEVSGKNMQEIFERDVYERRLEKLRQVVRTGEPVEFEDERGGRWFDSHMYPVFGEGDVVEAVAMFGRDITEERQATLERERLIAQLELKNRELENYTYTVSHDLRSPMITIETFLGFLREDLKEGDEANVNDDMRRITGAVQKLKLLLDDLLELSRVGRVVHPAVPISLGKLVQDVAELLSGPLRDRDVALHVEEEMPRVHADPVRLRQVFQNLIENAAKFSGAASEPEVRVSAWEDESWVHCTIEDNGIGLDPAYLERVFNIFEKLQPDTPGSGIGLALVRRIMEEQGGRVWLESEGLGHGVTAHVVIPRQSPEEDAE